jgi:hypothetical protein
MELSVETAHTYLQRGFSELLRVADGLGEPAINTRPLGPGTNAVAALIIHCCGVTEFWLGHVALGEPSDRDRDAEFSQTATLAELHALVEATLSRADTHLARLEAGDGIDEGGRKFLFGAWSRRCSNTWGTPSSLPTCWRDRRARAPPDPLDTSSPRASLAGSARRIPRSITSCGDAGSPGPFVPSPRSGHAVRDPRERRGLAMTITTTKLGRASALAAVGAGSLYGLIQFIHPAEDAATVTTPVWTVVSLLTAAMALLGLVSFSGLYLRNVERMGVTGLVGYLLSATFFLIIMGWSFMEVVALPAIAGSAPQFVDDVLAVPHGSEVVGDVGAAKLVSTVCAAAYLLGLLLFGIALFRAHVVARWAAVLLAVGAVSALLVPMLPHTAQRMMALPVGIALIGIGVSTWRRQGETPVVTSSPRPARRKDLATAGGR